MGTQRQNSQGSLFEAFASTAKELVKETTRQGSQEGLFAHMDKVSIFYFVLFSNTNMLFDCLIVYYSNFNEKYPE